MVRICDALPIKSTIAQWVLSLLQVRDVQLDGLLPPQTAGDKYGQQRQIPFTFMVSGSGASSSARA
jgi:hypothetical protein